MVPLLRSRLAAPTRYCVGVFCVRAGGGGAGLLWVCLRAGCVRVGVCVFACVRLFGGGGVVWLCLLFCSVVGLLVCARFCVSVGWGAVRWGRDMIVPPLWRGVWCPAAVCAGGGVACGVFVGC